MAELTDRQRVRLAALQGRPTSYEIVITRGSDGEKALFCYTPRANRSGILAAIRDRSTRLIEWCQQPGGPELHINVPARGDGAKVTLSDGTTLQPSGRTQRDAIQGGELPFHFESNKSIAAR